MPKLMLTSIVAMSTILVASLAAAQDASPTWVDVNAIFSERCTLCHSGTQPPIGLGLESYASVQAGSSRGPVVVPGDPEASELVRRIRGTSTPRMPLTGPPYLSEAQIQTIVAWVAAGAPGPGSPGATGSDDSMGTASSASESSDSVASPDPGTFAHVQSILMHRCASCHSEQGVMGAPPEGLVVTSYDAVLAGGERVVVIPGSPAASELLRRVEGWSLPRMPFDGPPFLDPEQIASIRTWIERGAPNDEGEAASVPVGAEVRLGGTLTAQWALDGLMLEVTSETRINDEPSVGSRVEVRGVVTEGGGVRATRIRPQ